MPLYEYQCENCGDVFELIQKFVDEPLTVHEKCGGPVHRLISAPALQFKGSGWYVNDYAKSGSPAGNGGKKDGDSSAASSDSKESAKSSGDSSKSSGESKAAAASESSKSSSSDSSKSSKSSDSSSTPSSTSSSSSDKK